MEESSKVAESGNSEWQSLYREVVWAKFKTYPWWPSYIINPDFISRYEPDNCKEQARKKIGKEYTVYFYADSTIGFIQPKSIRSFNEMNTAEFLKQKIGGKKEKMIFPIAIETAKKEAELDKLERGGEYFHKYNIDLVTGEEPEYEEDAEEEVSTGDDDDDEEEEDDGKKKGKKKATKKETMYDKKKSKATTKDGVTLEEIEVDDRLDFLDEEDEDQEEEEDEDDDNSGGGDLDDYKRKKKNKRSSSLSAKKSPKSAGSKYDEDEEDEDDEDNNDDDDEDCPKKKKKSSSNKKAINKRKHDDNDEDEDDGDTGKEKKKKLKKEKSDTGTQRRIIKLPKRRESSLTGGEGSSYRPSTVAGQSERSKILQNESKLDRVVRLSQNLTVTTTVSVPSDGGDTEEVTVSTFDEAKSLKTIEKIKEMQLDVDLMKKSKIHTLIHKLKNHENKPIAKAASDLFEIWMEMAKAKSEATAANAAATTAAATAVVVVGSTPLSSNSSAIAGMDQSTTRPRSSHGSGFGSCSVVGGGHVERVSRLKDGVLLGEAGYPEDVKQSLIRTRVVKLFTEVMKDERLAILLEKQLADGDGLTAFNGANHLSQAQVGEDRSEAIAKANAESRELTYFEVASRLLYHLNHRKAAASVVPAVVHGTGLVASPPIVLAAPAATTGLVAVRELVQEALKQESVAKLMGDMFQLIHHHSAISTSSASSLASPSFQLPTAAATGTLV